jgi:hypothetical protein
MAGRGKRPIPKSTTRTTTQPVVFPSADRPGTSPRPTPRATRNCRCRATTSAAGWLPQHGAPQPPGPGLPVTDHLYRASARQVYVQALRCVAWAHSGPPANGPTPEPLVRPNQASVVPSWMTGPAANFTEPRDGRHRDLPKAVDPGPSGSHGEHSLAPSPCARQHRIRRQRICRNCCVFATMWQHNGFRPCISGLIRDGRARSG